MPAHYMCRCGKGFLTKTRAVMPLVSSMLAPALHHLLAALPADPTKGTTLSKQSPDKDFTADPARQSSGQ